MIELVTLQVTQWRSVFWISAGVHIAGSGLYLLFGSDQVVSFKLFPLILIISFQNIFSVTRCRTGPSQRAPPPGSGRGRGRMSTGTRRHHTCKESIILVIPSPVSQDETTYLKLVYHLYVSFLGAHRDLRNKLVSRYYIIY